MKMNSAISQTILYGFSIALMKGISLIMLPFIAAMLTQEDFGKLEVLTSLAVIGSILVGLGLEDTLYRFAGQAKSLDEKKYLAANIFGLTIIFGIISLVLGWLVAPVITPLLPGNIDIYEVRLIIIMLALEGIIAVPLGWLRMQNYAISFFLMTVSRAAIQALLVVVLLKQTQHVAAVLEAGVIAAIFQAIFLSYLQIKDSGINLDTKRLNSIFIYSVPIVGTGLLAFILNGFDRWILAEYTNLVSVALYGVAAKFALATVLLLQPFNMWWSPKRFEMLSQENGAKKTVQIIQIGICLSLIISVAIGTSASLLITWLMPENYLLASQFIVGLVIVMLLKELSELVNIGCFVGESTSSQFYINIYSVIIGLICMIIGVIYWEVWGIIVSLILAQLFKLIALYVVSQKNSPLHYRKIPILLLSAVALILLAYSQTLTDIFHSFFFAVFATFLITIISFAFKLIPLKIKI